MSFGKANQPKHRHRPKKVKDVEVEVDEDKAKEERQDKMNSQRIPLLISIFGTIAMVGIGVMAAPYSYGSQVVHYTKGSVKEANELASEREELTQDERDEIDPHLLIDFTTVIVTPDKADSAAMKKVASACRQGRASSLDSVTPDKVHGAFKKATKHLTCAMATERARFCLADERAVLVGQLNAYKERRQNVLAFEKYRDKAVAKREDYRERKRAQGEPVPAPLNISKAKMNPEIDSGLLAQLELLVRNGYVSAADFGYYGLYVPGEYADTLRVGADRYAPCAIKT